MRHLAFLTIWFYALTANGQTQRPDSVLLKTGLLKRTLDQTDTLKPEQLWQDNSIDINGSIARQLTGILTTPEIVNYDLEKLLHHDFLSSTHSKDKRIWIFNWYENTGGSFKSFSSLIYYRTKSNQPKVVCGFNSDSEQNSFCSYGGSFSQIIKLKSRENDLFLALGSVSGCNTCCAEIATVLQLKSDTINFDYPAFEDSLKASPCFLLDSRCGDITEFKFNQGTQTISYSYITDDNTPESTFEEKSKTVKGKIVFNGKEFHETYAILEQHQKQITKSLVLNPGELFTALSKPERDSTTHLILEGAIDARDFKTIRDNMPSLEIIDLKKTKVAQYKGKQGTYGSYIYAAKDTTYPANVLPDFAFTHTNIQSVILPSTITSIGDFAFYECWELSSIDLPSVQSIGRWAFFTCKKLNTVIIPSSVKKIGSNAFAYCSGLTSVTLSQSLSTIDEDAFVNCSSLKSVLIPAAVAFIGKEAFWGCNELSTIVFENDTPPAFGKDIFGGFDKDSRSFYVPFNSKNNYSTGLQHQSNNYQIIEGKP